MKCTFIAAAVGVLLGLPSVQAGQLQLQNLILTGESELMHGPSTPEAPLVAPARVLTNNHVYMALVANYNALGKWYAPLKTERLALYKAALEKEKKQQTYAPELSKINAINTQIRARLPQILELQRRINVIEAEQKVREAKAAPARPKQN